MTNSTGLGYTPEEELRAVAGAYSAVCHSRVWAEIFKCDPIYEGSPERSQHYWRSAAEACAREAVRTEDPFRLEILRVAALFERGRAIAPKEDALPRIHPLIAWAMLTRPEVWLTGRRVTMVEAIPIEHVSCTPEVRKTEPIAVLDYRLERAILRLFERVEYAEDTGAPIIHPAVRGTRVLQPADGPTLPQLLETQAEMAEPEVEVRLKGLADRGVISWEARRLALLKPGALYKTTGKKPTEAPETQAEELARLDAELDRLLGFPPSRPRESDPTNIYRTASSGEITNERAVLKRPDGDAQMVSYPHVATIGKARASRKVPSDRTIAAWVRHEYLGDTPAEIAKMPHFAEYRMRAGKLSDSIKRTARTLEDQRTRLRFP